MTSGIDPITGLDTAINDPYLYQIPLTTNPIQAPEWGWRGHVDQVLYPDHIPSIFATAQGFDESNPGAAQAHHMDGDGNLYVNVRKNTAGGGGLITPLPANGSDTQSQSVLNGGDTTADFQAFAYIVGISVAASILNWLDLPDNETHANTVDFKFYNGYGIHSLSLGGYKSGTFWAGTFTAQEYLSFAYPIVPSGNDPDGAFPLAIEIKNNNVFDVLATVSITGKLA